MSINQQRIERRIQFRDEQGVLRKIQTHFQQQAYSDDHCTLNLLFDTPAFDLDNHYKIKARQYRSDLTLNEINPSEEFLLDFKVEEDGVSKKERTEGPLSEHISIVEKRLSGKNVRPRAGFIYERTHYLSDQFPETRITVDNNVTFFVLNKWTPEVMQVSDKQFFEFKYTTGDDAFEACMNYCIEQFGGIASLSKKEQTQQLARPLAT